MPIVLQCRENNFSTTKPDPRNFFDINAWREYWHQNMNILIHNQNIFREKNYHKIDLAALLP
jgi:hypothetical protein